MQNDSSATNKWHPCFVLGSGVFLCLCLVFFFFKEEKKTTEKIHRCQKEGESWLQLHQRRGGYRLVCLLSGWL